MKKFLIALVVMVGFAGTSMGQSKIGHVNTQVLLDTLPSSEAAGKKLQEFQLALKQELQDLGANLQKLYAEYEEMSSAPDPSKVLLQLKEKAITEKETEYQQRQQSIQLEYQAFQAELQQPIFDRISKAVGIIAKREKYDYVMDITNALYVNPANDVTDIVAVELLKLEAEATAKAATPPPANGK